MVHRELIATGDLKALPKAGLSHFWSWAIGRYTRHRVAGRSMLPTLEDGWVVLVDPKAYAHQDVAIGDVVLARFAGHSQHPCIKRVAGRKETGLDLRGDNPAESADSVELGLVPEAAILGKVMCTFP